MNSQARERRNVLINGILLLGATKLVWEVELYRVVRAGVEARENVAYGI